MPQSVQLSLKARFADGPFINTASTLDIEAYDVVKLTLPDQTDDKELVLQPAAQVDQVQLFAVSADQYGADLSYKVNDVNNLASTLDQPHLFAGTGAVKRATDGESPTKLFLSNQTGKDVEVHVYIGRDATP